MTSAAFNFFYRVDVTVAGYVGGGVETRTYSFVNKALKHSDGVASYWPILLELGELSLNAGEILPAASVSTVTIDNRRGTFGANRKFSDVLQRFSPQEQDVVFYVAQVANDTDSVSSWEQIGKAKCSTWETPMASGGNTLTFNIEPIRIEEKIITLEVARSVSGMESAPESSLGRAVPLVFPGGYGSRIAPIRISADGATSAKYAVSTCFYQHLQDDLAADEVYTKNFNDDWEQILNNAYDETAEATVSYGSLEPASVSAIAYSLGQVAFGGACLAVGVEFIAKAGGGSTSTALLNAFILRYDRFTKEVVDEVASGTAALNQYDALNDDTLNTSFSVKVSFDQPVFLAEDWRYMYALGIRCTGWQTGDMELHRVDIGALTGFSKAQVPTSTSGNAADAWLVGTYVVAWKAKILTASFSVNEHVDAYTQTGLTYSSLTVSQPTPDSGQTAPHFDNVPLLITSRGLEDYGSPFSLSGSPTSLVDRLSYTWNSQAAGWEDSATWDSSTLQSSHYTPLFSGSGLRSRSVYGYIDSRSSFSQVVTEICRGSASRVGILPSGKLFVYPWGVNETPAADIPASDIISLSWEQRNISTVVNRAVISIVRDPLFAPRKTDPGSNDVAGYAYTVDFSANNYPAVAALTEESRARFGNRELANGQFVLAPFGVEYLAPATTAYAASILAEYLFARFAKPHVYCTLVVPWDRYKALRQFNVVTFQHPEFPAFFGTDPEPDLPVLDDGSTVERVDINAGFEWTRSEPYRGLIEGVSYIMAMQHAPMVRLTMLVLLNQPFDPT